MPSAGFGLDFAAAAPGSIAPLDIKRTVFDAIREADLPYMVIYTNGFFSTWVATLGDLTRFGSASLPPAEVTLYGDGNVPATFVSEKDIAAVTLRALEDPKAVRREIRIAQNRITQSAMIELWRRDQRPLAAHREHERRGAGCDDRGSAWPGVAPGVLDPWRDRA